MDTIDDMGRKAATAVRDQVRPFVRDVDEFTAEGSASSPANRSRWFGAAAAVAAVAAVAVAVFVLTTHDGGTTNPVGTVTPTDAAIDTTVASVPVPDVAHFVPPSGIVLALPAGATLAAADAERYGVRTGILFDDGTLVRQLSVDGPIVVRDPNGAEHALPTEQGDGRQLTLYDAGVVDGVPTVLYGFVPADAVDASYPDGQALELRTIGADGTGDVQVFRIEGGGFLTSASMLGGVADVTMNSLGQTAQYLVGPGGLSVGPIATRSDLGVFNSADGTVQAVFTGQSIRARRDDGREAIIDWGDDRPTMQSVVLDRDRMIVNVADGAPFLFDELFEHGPTETRLPEPSVAADFVRPADAVDLAPSETCTWTGNGISGDGAMGSHYSQVAVVNATGGPCVAPIVTGGALVTTNGRVGLRFETDLAITALPPIVYPGQSVEVTVRTSSNVDVCGAVAPQPASEVRLQIETPGPGQSVLALPVSGDVIDAACGGSIGPAQMSFG